MKTISVIIVLMTFLFYGFVFAQNDNAGTSSGTFLKLSTNARTAALGHSGVALSGDASCIYYNPASVIGIKSTDLVLTFSSIYEEMKTGYIGIAIPYGIGVIGAGVSYFNSGEMTRTEAAPVGFIKTGTFTNSDIGFHLSYSRKFMPELSAGVTLKGVFETLAEKSASAFALDIGGFYTYDGIDFGLAVRNIGTGLKYDSVSSSLPMIISAGLAYHAMEGLLFTTSGDLPNDSDIKFNLGGEYRIIEYFALRLGYNTGQKDIEGLGGLTAGFGLFYKNFMLNYAYNLYGDFGAVHLISLGFNAF